jgi:hypothetical protein
VRAVAVAAVAAVAVVVVVVVVAVLALVVIAGRVAAVVAAAAAAVQQHRLRPSRMLHFVIVWLLSEQCHPIWTRSVARLASF